ncbi:MAG: ArsA family ATPase, partial [Actinomycetota bacterium]|nr:ArsA family ATPase [Actinomycetota bacterium]
MVAGKLATRAAGFGAGLFMRAASRITGQAVLGDLAEFFQSFDGMYDGFKDRAQAVYHLLQQPTSAFVVVASAEDPALREARFFLQRLESDGMPTAGLVVNRVTPPPSAGLAAVTPRAARAAANTLDEGGPESRAAAALLRLHVDRVEVAERERRAIAAALHGVDPRVLVQVPLMATDVHDLPGLTAIGRHLYAQL